MSLEEKGKESRELARQLNNKNELNFAANRFYYSVFQKTLYYAKTTHGYEYKSLSDKEKKGSHNSLIDYLHNKIQEEKRSNPSNKGLSNLNDFRGIFNQLKNFRVQADYLDESITKDDMIRIEQLLNTYDEKYSRIKQNLQGGKR